MIYFHQFFQDLVENLSMPGMPDLLRPEDVAADYERLTGHAPRNLDFYAAYAALRHGIVMFRIARRQARFGEAEMPEDPDHALSNALQLRKHVNGSYPGPLGTSALEHLSPGHVACLSHACPDELL